MMHEMATENNIALKVIGETTQVIWDEGMATKEYYAAEKTAIATAEDRLQKAGSFEEQKYWYGKMEQHTEKLGNRSDMIICLIVSISLFGVCMYCNRK